MYRQKANNTLPMTLDDLGIYKITVGHRTISEHILWIDRIFWKWLDKTSALQKQKSKIKRTNTASSSSNSSSKNFSPTFLEGSTNFQNF